MKNIGYLNIKMSTSSFKDKYHIKIQQSKTIIQIKHDVLGFTMLSIIIDAFKQVENKKLNKLPIVLNIGMGNEVIINDKLSYILLECCIYDYIVNHKFNFHEIKGILKTNIATKGYDSSLIHLINSDKKKNEFSKKFHDDTFENHYRSVIKSEDNRNLNIVYNDIASFLKIRLVEKSCTDEISHVLAELMDNAINHAKSDCLVDIDVTDNHNKINADGKYYGVNITVINFSKELFHNKLQNRIEYLTEKRINNIPQRYIDLISIYKYHKENLFNQEYLEEDFWTLASFQHKISGRNAEIDEMDSGGRGLTTLIESLQNRSDTETCYMISGKSVLTFDKEYLHSNDSSWLGFNKENNFKSDPPDLNIFSISPFYLVGTAYNLNFVLKKEG